MPSKIFDALLKEKTDIFKQAFTNISKQVFWDEKQNRLFHPGEYGMYRESICKDFIRFVIPRRLEIDQGFLINSIGEISNQCDIIVFDAQTAPLIETGERQRFYPIESVCAVGEVKSELSKAEFIDAINKLGKLKTFRNAIQKPFILHSENKNSFDPINQHTDQIFSFLICQKLNFNISDLVSDFNSMYTIPPYHRHNLILSIEDGLFLYYDKNNYSVPYPYFNGAPLKNQHIISNFSDDIHFKIFSNNLFLGTSSATIIFPEISHYIEFPTTGINSKSE